MAAGSDLRFLRVGDIELAYTTMGERDRPPVLLVAGLGAQLISWEDGFCDQLVDRGLFVIPFRQPRCRPLDPILIPSHRQREHKGSASVYPAVIRSTNRGT